MFLFHQAPILPHVALFVWQAMPDAVFALESLPDYVQYAEELAQLHHAARREEWLISRHLLYEIDGRQADFSLQKDAFGKPYICRRAYQISLSHTAHFTAIVQADYPCGVDIQVLTPKIVRIAAKFMHPTEWRNIEDGNPDYDLRLHQYWCAKEAVYKAWGKKNLAFKDIRIAPDFAQATIFAADRPLAIYALHSINHTQFVLVAALEIAQK